RASNQMTTGAIASIEDVASHIEDAFAAVGDHLGRGRALFEELNDGIASLSVELSGAEIADASAALQHIAAKLTALVEVLGSEGVLLGAIGASAGEASAALRPLVKHTQMVMIIARSARIEAATLDGSRDSFLDFTAEAFALAKAVQVSIEACMRDQQQLADAVATALGRQREFDTRYRGQLHSVSADLVAVHAQMQSRQGRHAQLAQTAGAGTKRMADAVGSAIVSLQAGDSTRQRLEHIGRALHIAVALDGDHASTLAPEATAGASTGSLVCCLQADQLKGTVSDFAIDLRDINASFEALLSGVAGVVDLGRALSGTEDGDLASFLSAVKRALAEASSLIKACESSRASVDDALTVVDAMLGKFRLAIASLSDTVVDIILIGMNAGLKAGQLGVKGQAFVVIANELKATADQISAGAGVLKPVLDHIEQSAGDLKRLGVDSATSLMTDLEPTILRAIGEIEQGSDHIRELMSRLVSGGTEFEHMVTSAQAILAALGGKSARLPTTAADLGIADAKRRLSPADMPTVEPAFGDLYAQYTMVSERDVHQRFARLAGLLVPSAGQSGPKQDDTDDVLFF
ncbi:MAG: chemotaxis protein, partial [Tardiphaga sp.]|nr:chemotaxis protein [Tardiphaga sp.]